MFNKYFRVDAPFRVWCHVGLSDSNAHIGRSQVINTVMEARNAGPGDEIHALVGGTFLVRDGAAWEISIHAPKHVFEKTYGRRSPATELAEDPRVSELLAPTRVMDYNAARDKVRSNRLRPLHPEVIEVEPSPGMLLLRAVVEPFAQDLREGNRPYSVSEADVDAYHSGRIRLTIEGRDGAPDRFVKVENGARGMVIVDLPLDEPVQGLPFEFPSEGRGRIYLRPETWPVPAEVAMRVLHEFVHRGTQAIEKREVESVSGQSQIEDVAGKIDEESNAPFLRLQNAVGQTDGGLASMHWSGTVAEGICRDMAEAVIRRSGGNVVDHGSPWQALAHDHAFEHSADLDDEPILARDLYLDNVEKRFGIRFGASERRDFGRRVDDVLEPYFDQERQWAEEAKAEAGEAPKP